MSQWISACKAICFASLASLASGAWAIPTGHNGFTADESDALIAQARQVASGKMKMSIKVIEGSVEAYDEEARYAQVELEISDMKGRPIDWSKTPCDSVYGKDSSSVFVLFKRQNKRWVAKGTALCAVEHPDWRDVDFRGR